MTGLAAARGYVMVTYVPGNALGYLIDYVVTGDGNAESDSYYDVLVNSLTFFPPIPDSSGADS